MDIRLGSFSWQNTVFGERKSVFMWELVLPNKSESKTWRLPDAMAKCTQNACRHSEVTWLGKIYTSAMLGPVKGWHAHALEWFSFLELLVFPCHENRDRRELILSLPVQVLDLPLNMLMFSCFLFPTKQINVS